MYTVIIHDGDDKFGQELCEKFAKGKEEVQVITDNGKIHNCVGCFGCWIKTPCHCVIKDGYGETGSLLGHTDQLIIVSKCQYGSYSPFVKNVMDRSISYSHPDFTKRKNEIHHKKRYNNRIHFEVFFYGECTETDRKTALRFTEANRANFDGISNGVHFLKTAEDVLNWELNKEVAE